ncbi:MAG: hypothetical protein LW600_05245 [Ilumatobacteraceae bacterium]|nr:hypothetical protein [Ilumatobacteraceae bacterium]
MNTTPSIDDLLEGLIVGLQNEIIPHLSNAKSVATAMMMQSLTLLGDVPGPEADRIRARAASLGSLADVAIPADQAPVREAHAQLGYGLQDTISDLDVLQRGGHATADAALNRVREFLMPTIMQNIAAISIGGGMIGRG